MRALVASVAMAAGWVVVENEVERTKFVLVVRILVVRMVVGMMVVIIVLVVGGGENGFVKFLSGGKFENIEAFDVEVEVKEVELPEEMVVETDIQGSLSRLR